MDRIIQQAMVQVLSPIFEEQFRDNSYGFRPGRSCEQAIIKALVKSEKAANRVLNSITKYLGFSFWATKGGKWKPKPHIKSYQKLKQLTDRSWSISLDNRIKQINYLVRGWVNYFRIANMKSTITKIDEHLRTRIRVIIWKQWKKISKRQKFKRCLYL